MKILPVYQAQNFMTFGAFMEGDLPDPLNYDIQTVLNNMVTGRLFNRKPGANGVQTYTPQNISAYQMSPAPAWTTVQGLRGKRVFPKVTLPYSKVYSEIVNAVQSPYQLESIMCSILNHRCHSAVADARIFGWPTVAYGETIAPKQNADGTFTVVEYDFGADVTLDQCLIYVPASTTNSVLNVTTFLQVLSGSTWSDVKALGAPVVNPTTHTLGYTGRKFRIVTKGASFPIAAGLSSFQVQFYGDYVSGTSPRTLGNIGHVVMIDMYQGSSYASGVLLSPVIAGNAGRLFPHYGLSITDNLTTADQYDVFISDAKVYPSNEQSIGLINVSFKPVVMGAY